MNAALFSPVTGSSSSVSPSASGCGGGACHCGGGSTAATAPAIARPSINGVALLAEGEPLPDAVALRERAFAELLRQQAVGAGLLPPQPARVAPELDEAQRQVIEGMVDDQVRTPQPTEEECQRYYEANKTQFVVGQAVHVRHILFAVTPGVDVHALSVHAEKALLELLGHDQPSLRFEQMAASLSNCPSSAHGGDLGWIGPQDCAPELANELFHQTGTALGQGVRPRLVHSRFGLHIVEVLGRRRGQQKTYAEVAERIAALLGLRSRARALHQYMSLLVGQARLEGLDLQGADSPLVQ